MELDAGTRRAVEAAVDRANAADHSEDTLEDHKSRISLPVRTQMLPELLEALQQGSAKLALSPELESMLNEATRGRGQRPGQARWPGARGRRGT